MRLGVDIGGTFTDFVLEDGARSWIHKVLTTPRRPAEGALHGMNELLASARVVWKQLDEIVHGTTLVTNALIERTGAATALLTTRGFRDVLSMGRQRRYDAYDLRLRFPEALVPRCWRREIDERVLPSGRILHPVDESQVREVGAELVADGVRAVAICFLALVSRACERADRRARAAWVVSAPRRRSLVRGCAADP